MANKLIDKCKTYDFEKLFKKRVMLILKMVTII